MLQISITKLYLVFKFTYLLFSHFSVMVLFHCLYPVSHSINSFFVSYAIVNCHVSVLLSLLYSLAGLYIFHISYNFSVVSFFYQFFYTIYLYFQILFLVETIISSSVSLSVSLYSFSTFCVMLKKTIDCFTQN